MKAFDFIHQELANLAKKFPEVNMKYGYNKVIKTHLIEFAPEEEYNFNEALDDAWIPFSFKFKETFPEEEIAFIPPSSTLSLKYPELEFNSIVPYKLFDKFYQELSILEFRYSFPKSIISEIIINNSFVKILQCPEQDIVVELSENIYQSAA